MRHVNFEIALQMGSPTLEGGSCLHQAAWLNFRPQFEWDTWPLDIILTSSMDTHHCLGTQRPGELSTSKF